MSGPYSRLDLEQYEAEVSDGRRFPDPIIDADLAKRRADREARERAEAPDESFIEDGGNVVDPSYLIDRPECETRQEPAKDEPGTAERPATVSLADLLAGYRDELNEPAPPSYFLGNSFRHLRFGPGNVTVLGGRPGAGKSALASQWIADILASDDDARVIVCNVEMSPDTLRDRLLARLSGVPYGLIREHAVAEFDDRVERGVATLATFADRLHFLRPLYDMGHVAAAADRVGANVVVLDYIQRIGVPAEKRREATETRARVNVVMDEMRRHADKGRAVLGLSALSRGRNSRGQSQYGVDADLASFKESGEIDYGVNDALILIPHPDDESVKLLRHVKSRDGEMNDVWLRFDGPRMSFAKMEPPDGK